MVASQSHWSRLDESNSAENPERCEGGFMLCLRFVQHKQDVAALLHLCCSSEWNYVAFSFPISGDVCLPHVWSREIINSQESAISNMPF